MKRSSVTIFVVLTCAVFGWALNHPNSVPIERVQSVELSYPIRFVVIGDTRFPGAQIFADQCEQILMVEPAPLFVINVGDLVLLGFDFQYQEYLSMIDPYPLPFISVIGNHEMYAPGGLDSYIKYFGPTDFYFDYGPLRFVAANNSIPGNYEVTQSQIDWMDEVLTNTSIPLKFTFLHVPPVSEFGNSDALHEVFVESNSVPIAFWGHEHRYQFWQQDNVTYLISGGGGAEIIGNREEPPYWGDFHHFFVVDVYPDGGIDVQVIRHKEGVTPDPEYGVYVQWDDTIPSIVSETWPKHEEIDVNVHSAIRVLFDEPMDKNSTELAFSITPEVVGHIEWDDEQTVVFIPGELLKYGTRYTAAISADASDAAGNAFDGDKDGLESGDYSFWFETQTASNDDDGDDDDGGGGSGEGGCGCNF